jgi:hypothetical protein
VLTVAEDGLTALAGVATSAAGGVTISGEGLVAGGAVALSGALTVAAGAVVSTVGGVTVSGDGVTVAAGATGAGLAVGALIVGAGAASFITGGLTVSGNGVAAGAGAAEFGGGAGASTVGAFPVLAPGSVVCANPNVTSAVDAMISSNSLFMEFLLKVLVLRIRVSLGIHLAVGPYAEHSRVVNRSSSDLRPGASRVEQRKCTC